MINAIHQKIFSKKLIFLTFLVINTPFFVSAEKKFETNSQPVIQKKIPSTEKFPLIKRIFIEGNNHIKKEAILNKIPFKEERQFDSDKTAEAIQLLYSLGFFSQIKIEKEHVKDNVINLYIVVQEKKLLEQIVFKGNKKIKTKTFEEKLNIEKIEAIDNEQLKQLVHAIIKLYKEENHHITKVSSEIVENKKQPDKAKVIITINEGPKTKIKRVNFVGNKHLPYRKLCTFIFTREDWIFGFMNDAGKYSEDMLEMDKRRIEYLYRDHGYLAAKVTRADVEFSKDQKEINVTFEIKEGDQYTIRTINTPGDEIFDESDLLPYVTIEEGRPFSQSKLIDTINNLKTRWGTIGYIYADVYPQIIPDEKTKDVDITFFAEKGDKVLVNRINITGNKSTKDKVIRREILLEEGDLITSPILNFSKENVEYLGFFDRGGVNWKMHKISDEKVDLEMNVKEARTGHLNFEMSMGGDKNPSNSLKGKIDFGKNNFWGYGWDVGLSVQADRHKAREANFYFFDPYILDSNVSGNLRIYAKQAEYEQWKTSSRLPLERTIGSAAKFGIAMPWLSRRTTLALEIGAESIHFKGIAETQMLGANKAQSEKLFRRRFADGDLYWLSADLIKDTRNHRIYPSHGYKIILSAKTAPPFINREFSFIKTELDWSWYTPIIGDDLLVLGLHSSAGIIDHISQNKVIPYKELFHMGGQGTVRGFTWGGIEPAWQISNDPIGARKAVQFNAELIFPLIQDYSMKGHVFYDAGAGWDTPKDGIDNMSLVKRNTFNLRHAVGFGINLLKPTNVKIDWGYKLDRNKKEGESPHEFHLSMNAAW
jgi:outer membrane protein insertion porin family